MGKLFDTNIEKNPEVKKVSEYILKFYNDNKTLCDTAYKNSCKLSDIYTEILDKDIIDESLLTSSVVIITANAFEKKLLHFRSYKETKKKIGHCQINCSNNIQHPLNINLYFLQIGKFKVIHLEALQTGSYTIGGSADLVRYVLKNPYIHPSCIISFGICFGNDYEKHPIGDSIITQKVYPYFISAKVTEVSLEVTDNNIFRTNEDLLTRLRHMYDKGSFNKTDAYIDNLITGEAVVNNALIKDIFVKSATNQKTMAGDMEAYGLYKECQGFDHSMPCFLVKSICDYGVAKNIDDIFEEDSLPSNIKDILQAYASNKAYDVLKVIFNERDSFINSSIYSIFISCLKNLQDKDNYTLNKKMIDDIIKEIQKYAYKTVDKSCVNLILNKAAKDGHISRINNGNTIFKINSKRGI